jgi:hypothetical protein
MMREREYLSPSNRITKLKSNTHWSSKSIPGFGMARFPLFGFNGRFDYLSKGARVFDRNIRQQFTVNIYAGGIHRTNQLAVAHPVSPGCGINAGNPEASHITLALAAMKVSIIQRMDHRFMGAANEFMPGSSLPFNQF